MECLAKKSNSEILLKDLKTRCTRSLSSSRSRWFIFHHFVHTLTHFFTFVYIWSELVSFRRIVSYFLTYCHIVIFCHTETYHVKLSRTFYHFLIIEKNVSYGMVNDAPSQILSIFHFDALCSFLSCKEITVNGPSRPTDWPFHRDARRHLKLESQEDLHYHKSISITVCF